MSLIVGVDSGAAGAITFMDGDTGKILEIFDMPVDKIQVGKHARSRVNRPKLMAIFNMAKGAIGVIERPEARPMRQTDKQTGRTTLRQPGAAGMLSLGENYGCLVMGMTAAGIAVNEIRPGEWKSEMSVKAAKDDARRRAEEMFPADVQRFARIKDDGRAESALMAAFQARIQRGGRRNARHAA